MVTFALTQYTTITFISSKLIKCHIDIAIILTLSYGKSSIIILASCITTTAFLLFVMEDITNISDISRYSTRVAIPRYIATRVL